MLSVFRPCCRKEAVSNRGGLGIGEVPYGHMDIRSLKCKMLARVRDPFRLADIVCLNITEAKILFFFFSCNHTLTTCAVLFPSCLFSPTHEKNSEIRIVIANRFQMRGLVTCQVAGSSCVLFAFASFDELIHIGRCGCACKISWFGTIWSEEINVPTGWDLEPNRSFVRWDS